MIAPFVFRAAKRRRVPIDVREVRQQGFVDFGLASILLLLALPVLLFFFMLLKGIVVPVLGWAW